MDIERRYVTSEVRATAGEDGVTTIEGHAAVFNKDSEEMFGFVERVAPGAFAAALARPDDVRALFNHDPNMVLGRNTAGTLELAEDEVGLRYRLDLPDTQVGRDLAVSMQRGDVSQSSFGFRVVKQSWELRSDGPDIRTIEEAELFDVSPVTYPAYPDADVAIRSHNRAVDEARPVKSNHKSNLVEIHEQEQFDLQAKSID
jgi:HK97 family phage prohead protease